MNENVNIEQFITRFNNFWNAADKLKRSQIIEILELGDKKIQVETFRNLLDCDTSHMVDDYLVSLMRIVAACGNKKSIVLGHLASGNKEYEKLSDAYYAIQRLNKKYKELESSEETQKCVETKNKVVFEINGLDAQIRSYFESNNLAYSDFYVSNDLKKSLTEIKTDLEGKNEILNWQIANCRKAKSNKTYYATVKSAREFQNTLISNVDGKIALVAYRRDSDKRKLFESKHKYQARMNECINTIFDEIQCEINQKRSKLDDALEMINKRDMLAGSLGIDTSVYNIEQVSKILTKYRDDIAVTEGLIQSYENQKDALISQIKACANEVNIDYRYAMQNLLVLA